MAPSKRQRAGKETISSSRNISSNRDISNDGKVPVTAETTATKTRRGPFLPSSLVGRSFSRNGMVFLAGVLFLLLHRCIQFGIMEISTKSSSSSIESQESELVVPKMPSEYQVGSDSNSTEFRKNVNGKSNRTRTIHNSIKKDQIDNYRKGKGLMLNLHATHHGGTTFCGIIGRSGGPMASSKKDDNNDNGNVNKDGEISPSFACWFDHDNIVPKEKKSKYTFLSKANFFATTPWRHDETDTFIRALRPYFHMVSWEYMGVDDLKRNLSETNWEHPNLLSVAITRHPISRLLAGSRNLLLNYPGYNTGTLSHAGWWDIATNPKRKHADNFFFRIIEGTPRVEIGVPTNNLASRRLKNSKKQNEQRSRRRDYLFTDDNLPSTPPPNNSNNLNQTNYERAVSILDRFTVVLDIDCLHEGIQALANLLGLDQKRIHDSLLKNEKGRISKGKTKTHQKQRSSLKDRIGYQDVYEYLLEKNKWDIKLYEYSKSVSLVRCEQ